MSDGLATSEVEALRAEVAGLRARVEDLEEAAEAKRDILDIPGCARLLGVSRKTVRRRMAEGRPPCVRLGGDRTVRFVRADVIAALRKGLPRRGTPRLHSKLHAPPARASDSRRQSEGNPAKGA